MTTTPTPLVAPFTVLSVTDTRDFIEQGDRWVPVPGSGDPHQCQRCDRTHEIHATVQDANGATGIVGTGCMDASTAHARSLAGKATTVAKRAARDADATAAATELAELTAAAKALPFPEHLLEEGPGIGADGTSWTVEDARVFLKPYHDRAERMDCLRSTWHSRRLTDLAGGYTALHALRRRADRAPT